MKHSSTHKATSHRWEKKPTGRTIESNFNSPHPEHHHKAPESINVKIALAGEVIVEIDVDEIARTLGAKALASKTGRAVECSGLIVVRRKTCQEVLREDQPCRALYSHERYI